MWPGTSDNKFIAFMVTIFVIIFSSLYMLSLPLLGHALIIIWVIAGSIMFFGGFLVFDALKTRKQYLAFNTGGVLAIGGFIVLMGFSILWFIYFVKWD